jgi:hypothetical protein
MFPSLLSSWSRSAAHALDDFPPSIPLLYALAEAGALVEVGAFVEAGPVDLSFWSSPDVS